MQPEANFRARVHRRLKKLDLYHKIHIQSMEAGNGTPDYYYESRDAVLWVEYKVYPNSTSTRQNNWIERARRNGIDVWVASWHPTKRIVLLQTNTGEKPTELEFPAYVDRLYSAMIK